MTLHSVNVAGMLLFKICEEYDVETTDPKNSSDLLKFRCVPHQYCRSACKCFLKTLQYHCKYTASSVICQLVNQFGLVSENDTAAAVVLLWQFSV